MIVALLGLLGCGPRVDCAEPGSVLAEAGPETLASPSPRSSAPDAALPIAGSRSAESLTCAEGDEVVEWVKVLAGRPLQARGDRELALAEVRERFVADPAATRAWIAEIHQRGAALAGRIGLDASEARAHEVWLADRGEGPVRPEDGFLWNLQQRTLSVWAKDDQEQLALTEADLEGWIRYASLCREAQGGGVVRISVSDRVTVYQMLIDRFQAGDRATQVALASLGPVWPQVVDAWAAAPYEQQQAWIAAAPLPPPMTATSLAYVGAVFEGDVVGLARALQDVLGPFPVDAEAHFGPPPPAPRWRPPTPEPSDAGVQVSP